MDLQTFLSLNNLKNKTQALNKCSELLGRTTHGEIITNLHPEYNFLCSLIKVHYTFNNFPIEHFAVFCTKYYQSKCFHFYDGKRYWDFSFKKCLMEREKIKRLNIQQAFRNAIASQIRDFRKNTFNGNASMVCPITNNVLWINSSHTVVDHNYEELPFRIMLTDFITKENIDYDKIKVYEDCSGLKQLCDKDLLESWQIYHNENASLRVIHYTANQKHTR